MPRSRLSNLFVVAVFTLGIGLPAVQQSLDLLPQVDVVDNRVLARFPPLSADPGAVRQFPDRFESWYADHMGLRGALVTGYRFVTDAVLGSPDKVIVGRDDWLYLRRGIRADIETVPLVRDWCGRFEFPDHQLDRWVEAITANQRWLNERGIDYLFVVPPNKMTVLPDHLPAHFECRPGTRRLEQLQQALRARSGIELVSLTGPLRRAAEQDTPIWYRTDTHWTPRGVAAGYDALLDRVQALRPSAHRITAFEVQSSGRVLGDLGQMVHRSDIEPDVNWSVKPEQTRSRPAPMPFPDQADAYGRRSSARTIDDPALPTAMVFHDSYFDGAMNEFLAESFRRTVFVFHGRPEINRELVKVKKPDIVIHEMVERNLLHPFYTGDW